MSVIEVNKLTPLASNGTITLGDSGDTFSIPSGVTLSNAGTATGFGKIGQVVSAVYDTLGTSTSSSSFVAMGLSVAITPSATSSKILVQVSGGSVYTANDKNGFLGFSYKNPNLGEKYKNYKFPNYLEYEYTKSDLIKYFGLSYDDEIIQSPQVWGGSFFIRKCKNSEELMNKHYEITRNRYDLIDDDENKFLEKSLPGFIVHRHSQSVLSILAKKINCRFLSAYESEWALDELGNRTFEHTNSFPVIAKRDKQRNIFLRFIDRQAKNIRRRVNKLKI